MRDQIILQGGQTGGHQERQDNGRCEQPAEMHAGAQRRDLVIVGHSAIDDATGKQHRRRHGVRQRVGHQERDDREDLRRRQPALGRLLHDATDEKQTG